MRPGVLSMWVDGDWLPLASIDELQPVTDGQQIGRRVVAEWLVKNPHLPVPDDYQETVDRIRSTRQTLGEARRIREQEMTYRATLHFQHAVKDPSSFVKIVHVT